MRISALAIALSLSTPVLAEAQVSNRSAAATQEPAVALLSGHTYAITVKRDGKQFTGTLQIGSVAVEHATPRNTALNAFLQAPADQIDAFYGYTGALADYFSRFETSSGDYVLGSFVYVGNSTVQQTPSAVSIVLGSPQPGSLSGGGGIDTLQGNVRANGARIAGNGKLVSGYPDSFQATIKR